MMIALITIGTEFSSYTSLRYTYSWLFFWATETHTSNVRYCLCNGRKHLGLVGEAGIDKKKKKSHQLHHKYHPAGFVAAKTVQLHCIQETGFIKKPR